MKKFIIATALLFSLTGFNTTNAQIRVNVNIGAQPNWGPVGYDYVDYYYLPDIETYYYVPKKQFVHLNPAGKWVFSNGLPPAYRSYNLYTGYKVVINEPNAYNLFNTHKVKYVGYKGNRSQGYIKKSNDPKYYVVKGHPKYKSNPSNGNGGGNKIKVNSGGRGNGKGKGNH